MKHTIFLFLVLVIISCRPQKEATRTITEYINQTQTDTVKIVERDTTFLYHPAPEVSTSSVQDSSYLETSLAWSLAVIKNGLLLHKIGNKPAIPIRAPGVIRSETKSKTSSKEKENVSTYVKVITKERFRFMNAYLYYSGIAFHGLVAIALILILLIGGKKKGGS